MFQLEFSDTDDGRSKYEICFQALALAQRPPQISEFADVVSIIKQLKANGAPGKTSQGDVVLYDLKKGGATIALERSEYGLLKLYVTQPIWRPISLESVVMTKDWLEGLKESEHASA